MPQISKYQVKKDIMKRVYEILIESLLKLKNEEEAKDFLTDLLTPTEQVMVAKRLSIAVLLAKGYKYESIMDILKVSRTTITRVKNILSLQGDGYQKIIDRVLKKEKIKKIFYLIDDIWNIVPPKGRNWSAWGKARYQKKMNRQRPL